MLKRSYEARCQDHFGYDDMKHYKLPRFTVLELFLAFHPFCSFIARKAISFLLIQAWLSVFLYLQLFAIQSFWTILLVSLNLIALLAIFLLDLFVFFLWLSYLKGMTSCEREFAFETNKICRIGFYAFRKVSPFSRNLELIRCLASKTWCKLCLHFP